MVGVDRLLEISLRLNSAKNIDSLVSLIKEQTIDLLQCDDIRVVLYEHDSDKLISENRVRDFLDVPIEYDNQEIGTLQAISKKSREFNETDAKLLAFVAAQTAIAFYNAKSIQELRQADQVKADFLAVASHELRTPLGLILGYATFLKEEVSEELSEIAETLLNAALRLRSLLEDMTHMNLLYTGATELDVDVFSIHEIVQSVYAEATKSAAEKSIEMDLPTSEVFVKVDPRIQQVFLALLNNAIRFTPNKGKINICVTADDQDVLVSVDDNGIGIPPDKLERIFDQFYQVEHHMTRRHEGLGLGLAIARGMVELHGGRIWAESDGPGKGSAFKVLLPRVYPE